MNSLEKSVDKFIGLQLMKNSEYNYHSVVYHIFEIIHNIDILEKEGVSKLQIENILKEATEIIGVSPFFNRLQNWPKGYPGDFETIQYLLDSKNKSKKHSIQFYIEQYGLLSPAAQQHRNKVSEQTTQLLRAYSNRSDDKLRVLSIGCGGNPDIKAASYFINPKHVEFVLLDGDNDAINASKNILKKYSKSSVYIHGNIIRSLAKLKGHGKFQLVIAGGLFDYLQDNVIVKILKKIRENNLEDRGKIIFTNISPDNPDRIWMEYLANWNLISRTKNNLTQLVVDSGFSEKEVKISKDTTNITYLIEITRKI